MELAVADVDGGDAGGAALEQDVGEAAGRCADVDTVAAGWIEAERVQRVRKLVRPTRDVARG